jgi:hypothetical protein
MSESFGPLFDSAGVPSAPCSGHRLDDETCVCGHPGPEHDGSLVCRVCHAVCGYCGQFYDQHNWHEWLSCQTDIEHAEQEADALAWWKSQQ